MAVNSIYQRIKFNFYRCKKLSLLFFLFVSGRLLPPIHIHDRTLGLVETLYALTLQAARITPGTQAADDGL
jgi:hypothetical protein